VAVMHEGCPVAAAIFDASTGQTYSAAAGAGATCQNRTLRVAERPFGPDSTIAFSSFRLHPVPRGIRGLFDEVLFRNIWSACLHQAWVAAGLVDAIYAPDTKVWDVAAGALIISEAGGRVTNVEGRPRWPWDVCQAHDTHCSILAGGPAMHSYVL